MLFLKRRSEKANEWGNQARRGHAIIVNWWSFVNWLERCTCITYYSALSLNLTAHTPLPIFWVEISRYALDKQTLDILFVTQSRGAQISMVSIPRGRPNPSPISSNTSREDRGNSACSDVSDGNNNSPKKRRRNEDSVPKALQACDRCRTKVWA